MSSQVLFQIQSVLIVLLMFYGVYVHKNRKRHVKIMSGVIAWDLILILQIELSRSAILKASSAMMKKTDPMLYVHLFFAVSTVVLYVLMILSGRKVLAGINEKLPLHKKLGITTMLFRLATLATSFFAVVN